MLALAMCRGQQALKLDNRDGAMSVVSAGFVCGWSELVNRKSIWGRETYNY